MTRLDISYVVSKCARYCNNPISTYNAVAKRIIRYLSSIRTIGLFYCYRDDEDGGLLGYTNSLWRDCCDTRRSTSAYVFLL